MFSNRWKIFTLVISLCVSTVSYSKDKKVAIVIGNNHYQHLNPLSNSGNDARAIAEKLKSLDFKLIGVTPEQDNRIVSNATQEQLYDLTERFKSAALGAKIAVIYFAGHGFQFGTQPYVIPVDAPKPKRKSQLKLLKDRSVTLESLLDASEQGAELTVGIFDACREIPSIESLTRSAGLSNSYRGLAAVRKSTSDRVIAYSAAANELAQDGEGQHSPYTQLLLEYIDKPGFDVANMLVKVSAEYKKQHHGQRPEVINNGVEPNMYYLAEMHVLENQPLLIDTFPKDASIKVLNIPRSYRYGIKLQPGSYQIEVSQKGYETQTTRFDLSAQNRQLTVTLKEKPKHQDVTYRLKGISFTLKAIPGGSFEMGSNNGDDDEKPVHTVTIKPFKLMEHEVTWEMFNAFVEETNFKTDAELNSGGVTGCYVYSVNENKWAALGDRNWRSPGFSQSKASPITCVSWHDAQAFSKWLTKETGKRFRLPSEAEWEYAARAGSQEDYSFGDDSAQLCRYGNGTDQTPLSNGYTWSEFAPCRDGYGDRTAPVRSFMANEFGLYDMHGNVMEWIQDCWNNRYDGAPDDGSAWMEGDCERAVLRGDSWFNKPSRLRSANRDWYDRTNRDNDIGFRLAQD